MIDFNQAVREYVNNLTANELEAFKNYIKPYDDFSIADKYNKAEWTYFAIEQLGNQNIVKYQNLLRNQQIRDMIGKLVEDYHEKEWRRRQEAEFDNWIEQLAWANDPSHTTLNVSYQTHDKEAYEALVESGRIKPDSFPKHEAKEKVIIQGPINPNKPKEEKEEKETFQGQITRRDQVQKADRATGKRYYEEDDVLTDEFIEYARNHSRWADYDVEEETRKHKQELAHGEYRIALMKGEVKREQDWINRHNARKMRWHRVEGHPEQSYWEKCDDGTD